MLNSQENKKLYTWKKYENEKQKINYSITA